MATEAVYQIFAALYKEEEDRFSELVNRAKIYLSICTFFLGGSAFKLSFDPGTHSAKIIALAGVTIFITTFLLIIMALAIFSYEGRFDPREVVTSFGDDVPADADFRDDRIADIVVAYERNSRLNDTRATLLQLASGGMFLGVVVMFASFVMSTWL